MVGICPSAADAAPLSPPPGAPAAEGHGGGALDDDTFLPLLDLLERFPDLFAQKVLQRLDPIDRTFFAQAGGAYRAAVVASDLPRAGTGEEVLVLGRSVWVVTHKVREFCTSVERLAWAKASGCPWVEQTCAVRRFGRATGGPAVGAGARVPVGREDLSMRRCGRAPRGAEVGAGARLPVERYV